MDRIEKHLTRALRQSSGRILASLIKQFGNFDRAEDALQDAAAEAMRVWPEKGLPQNPAAWLHMAAKRRAIDKLRKESRHNAKDTLQAIADIEADKNEMAETDYEIPDERLRLIFTCCHPALSDEAQLALTLRTLGGLTVREIARAFLTSETAMLQRITRAKKKIQTAGIAYEVPGAEQIEVRRRSVQKTIYLIFNESYSAFEGQSLTRDDLANEAIRLGKLLYALDPTTENGGLLALMQFTHARSKARTNDQGQMISLEHQDRSAWDQTSIEEATELLATQLRTAQLGPYQLQAAISGVHSRSPSWEQTDWQQIAALYGALAAFDPSPVVLLNAAMAEANMGNLDQAMIKLEALAPYLENYQPFYAARAELHQRQGNFQSAYDDLTCAIELTKNEIEIDFLLQKRLDVAKCNAETKN